MQSQTEQHEPKEPIATQSVDCSNFAGSYTIATQYHIMPLIYKKSTEADKFNYTSYRKLICIHNTQVTKHRFKLLLVGVFLHS